MALAALLVRLWTLPVGGTDHLSAAGRTTLTVFVLAVTAWAFTPLDDTLVALAAGAVLVLVGAQDRKELFSALGEDVIWLLVATCVLASAVTAGGLAQWCAARLVARARTPRRLVHLVTAGLVVTTFALPSTSGRAAMAAPVFVAIAAALDGSGSGPRRPALVRVLALVFPTVILLSAVGSLLGAGAHLVTSLVVQDATGRGFDFVGWLLLGLPLAVLSSHLAAELVLLLFSRRQDRRGPLYVQILEHTEQVPVSARVRAAVLLAVTVALWCTEGLHGIHPAVVALVAALVATAPGTGLVRLPDALAQVPWSLLLFMAATLAMGRALLDTGAIGYLTRQMFIRTGTGSPLLFLTAVVVLSTASHLLIQSRSARSAVLVPMVVALAPAAGVDAAAAAFASTAAAGFCHTLPSSAKPVAMFSRLQDVPTYTAADLRWLSAWLAPLHVVLVLAMAVLLWPHLGLPLR